MSNSLQSVLVQDVTNSLRTCPTGWVRGRDTNGHEFLKLVYCGREWCPICGANESSAHMRRIARWLPRVQQLKGFGYWVFTIPEEMRDGLTVAILNFIMKAVTSGYKRDGLPGIMEKHGFSRGLSRWHWYGDKSDKFNPHLNVITDSAQLTKSQILSVKKAFKDLLQVDNVVVHYSYKRRPAQMYGALKYITRPTFRDFNLNPSMALELFNFRNNRSWGKTATNNHLSEWLSADGAFITKKWAVHHGDGSISKLVQFEKGRCPLCGAAIHWHPMVRYDELKVDSIRHRTTEISPGYYFFNST